MSQSLIKFELNSLKSQEITLRQAQRPRFGKLSDHASTSSTAALRQAQQPKVQGLEDSGFLPEFILSFAERNRNM